MKTWLPIVLVVVAVGSAIAWLLGAMEADLLDHPARAVAWGRHGLWIALAGLLGYHLVRRRKGHRVDRTKPIRKYGLM